MDLISCERERNYLPHDFSTRINVVKRIKESGWPIKKAANIYHVSRKTIWRWLTKYDGTEGSLMDKSHRPHSEHPRKTLIEAVSRISSYRRRNPDDSSIDIWVKPSNRDGPCAIRHASGY